MDNPRPQWRAFYNVAHPKLWGIEISDPAAVAAGLEILIAPCMPEHAAKALSDAYNIAASAQKPKLDRTVLSHHRVITEECRTNHGDDGAMDEALATSREAIEKLYRYWPIGKGATIHVKIEVEYPDERQR